MESISDAGTRHNKIMLAKIFFEYMISQKNNILDLNVPWWNYAKYNYLDILFL